MPDRTATYGRDLRFKQEEAEQAVELYKTAVRERRGRIIFIPGHPGSGRTDILQTISDLIAREQPRPRILGGHFTDGNYVPWRSGGISKSPLIDSISTGGQVLSLASNAFGPALSPVAQFLGQLLQVSGDAAQIVDDVTRKGGSPLDSPQAFKMILRQAAALEPVVCLLDDLDKAAAKWIPDWLVEFASEVATDLQLLIFVTLDGPPKLPPFEEAEPKLFTVARYLVKRGLAEWRPVKPLSKEEIAEWVGATAPGIVGHIQAVTGGYPLWVIELWKDWQHRGRLSFSDKNGQWQWVEGRTPSLNLVKDVIDERLGRLLGSSDFQALEKARRVLAYAALEGDFFTADAIAEALGIGRDELIDFLDEKLVRNEKTPEGIVEEDRYITIQHTAGDTKHLWRYQFVSKLFPMALQRYGLTLQERKSASLSLVEALIELYSPKEQHIAPIVARLSRMAGDVGKTLKYQRMADYSANREALRQQAQYVISINKEEWDATIYGQAAGLLLDAGWSMLGAYPHQETLAVFDAAYELATRAGSPSDKSTALHRRGIVHTQMRNYEQALMDAQDALQMFQQSGSRNAEAYGLYQLGSLDYLAARYEEAAEKLLKANGIWEQLGNVKEQSSCLFQLGCVDLAVGRYKEAKERFQSALDIREGFEGPDNIASVLLQLGRIDFELGDYEKAKSKSREALDLSRIAGNRAREAEALHQLATIDAELKEYEDARKKSYEVAEIYRYLGDVGGEATTLHQIGHIELELGNYDEAKNKLQKALEIRKEIGNQNGIASTLHELARCDFKTGNAEQAVDKLYKELEICRRIGDRKGEAYALYWIAKVNVSLRNHNYAQEKFDRAIEILRDIGDHKSEAIMSQELEPLLRKCNAE